MAIPRGLHPAETVARYRAEGSWTDETVDQLYRHQVATRAEELALVDPANRLDLLGSPARRLTWLALDDEVVFLTARLLELGLRRGDVLGVQIPNTVELVEVYLAAWSIGVVVSPLPMQYRELEIVGMANQAEFAAFITVPRFSGRSPLGDVVAARDQIPSLTAVIGIGLEAEHEPAVEGAVSITPTPASDSDRALVSAHVAADPNDPNDCLTVCWTSGTESQPKGVPRAHYEWLAIAWLTVDGPALVAEDVMLNPFPMVNMAGINSMLLPWLRVGCTLVQHHPFDLQVFLQQVQDEGITYTCAPPAVLWMLLHDEKLLATFDLSSLTRISSGSVPLQPVMVRGWQERFGIGILNLFGSNEGVALMSGQDDFPDPEDRAQYFPRYGAPGVTWSARHAAWATAKLVDVATDEEITEPGRPGELRFGGPTVFSGYLNGHLRPTPFDEDGFLRTGDLFEITGDQDQYLRYLDRAKDLVIRGGMNIAPAELEGLIADHPAVADVAVVGDPDEVLGERVAAIVSLHPGASLDLPELIAFLRGRKIASFKLPERLEVLGELPRNPVGKILKRELRRSVGEPVA